MAIARCCALCVVLGASPGRAEHNASKHTYVNLTMTRTLFANGRGLLDAREASYECRVFALPPDTEVVSFEPIIGEHALCGEAWTFVHHVDLFVCDRKILDWDFEKQGGAYGSDTCAYMEFLAAEGPCYKLVYFHDRGAGRSRRQTSSRLGHVPAASPRPLCGVTATAPRRRRARPAASPRPLHDANATKRRRPRAGGSAPRWGSRRPRASRCGSA